MLKILDSFSSIDAIMLINTVKFSQTVSEGSRTELTFVDHDAYKVQAERPIEQDKSNDLGSLFS